VASPKSHRLKRIHHAAVVSKYRKKIKRLVEKAKEARVCTIWNKQVENCKAEAPQYYQWLLKQMNRFGKKGYAKYDIQERAMALTLYYTSGENGYR